MKISRVAGNTSEVMQVFIQDSTSTTGAGKTGLLFNTASLTAYYKRSDQATWTVINLVTMTAGTFTSSGFVESDATHAPGWYDFCPPNAVFTSGRSAAIHIRGATGMADVPIEVEITAVNNQSATGFVSSVPAVVGAVGSVTGAVGSVTGAVGSVTGAVGSVAAGGIAAASFAAGAIDATAIATDAIGSAEISAAAVTKIQAGLATPTNITAGVITTVTNLTNAPTAGDFTATMKTSAENAVWNATTASHVAAGSMGLAQTTAPALGAGAITSATFAAGAINAAAIDPALVFNANMTSSGLVDIGNTILRTALTEAYAADGAAGTASQILFLIQQMLAEWSVAGTTATAKKLDGSTTAATFTLNDGTNPTSITRTT